jgi:hypothetical protein
MEPDDLLCSRNARPEKTRAVGDQSAPIPEEITSELGGSNIVVHRSMRAMTETLPSPHWYDKEIELDMLCRRYEIVWGG